MNFQTPVAGRVERFAQVDAAHFPQKTSRFFGMLGLVLFQFLWPTADLAAQDLNKIKLGKIVIPEENDDWEIAAEPNAPPPKPIVLRDKTGKPLDPTKTQKVKNKTLTNKTIPDEVNLHEKKLNQYGRSLNDPGTKALFVPKGLNELEAQNSKEPSEGKFLEKEELDNRKPDELELGGQKINPTTEPSEEEFLERRKKAFNVQGKKLSLAASDNSAMAAPGTLLKNLNYEKRKEWAFGLKSIFKVDINANAKMTGKYYQPAGQEAGMTQAQVTAALQNTQTEFRLIASGRATGHILGAGFNIVDAKVEGYLPANSTKKSSVKVNIKMAFTDVVNINKEFSGNFDESAHKKVINKQWGLEYSLTLLGIPVSGEIGAKGDIGYSWRMRGTAPYFLAGEFVPSASLAGYAEAAVDIWLAEAGVRGELVFVKGSVPIEGHAFLLVGNNVLLQTSLYAGYRLEFLSGKLTVYYDVVGFDPRDLWTIWESAGWVREGNFLEKEEQFTFNW